MSIKNNRGIINYNLDLKNFARSNRKNLTVAEVKIWQEVLSNKKTGYKFLRQKPIDNFILDFYCSKLLLAIEIDGDSHYQNKNYDLCRTQKLTSSDIKVIRYTNDEVINNSEGVYQNILKQIGLRKNELKKRQNKKSPC